MRFNGEILSTETILDDDYPVYFNYCYVCDGEVQCSPIEGNIALLKYTLNVKEIRRCDIAARYKEMPNNGSEPRRTCGSE